MTKINSGKRQWAIGYREDRTGGKGLTAGQWAIGKTSGEVKSKKWRSKK